MRARICFLYAWATSGGVERVFLNRGEVLLRKYPELDIEVYFYHDCGGLAMFTGYLKSRGLSDHLRVVPEFHPSRYDFVFAIDTPQVLTDHPSLLSRLFMECHTPYPEHRAYLRQWQTRLERLLVPSDAFRQLVEAECPRLKGKVTVLRDFIPLLPGGEPLPQLPAWTSQIFVYLGRIDNNKNVSEFVTAVARACRFLPAAALGIVCGPLTPGYPWEELIVRHNAHGSIVLLPPVPFTKTYALLRSLREKKAVYVSCSRGESFGLSVAEAMTEGLPVILSDIPPHADLVLGKRHLLYDLGNVYQLTVKMATAVEHYDAYSSESLALSREFSERGFLDDWERLFSARSASWQTPAAVGGAA